MTDVTLGIDLSENRSGLDEADFDKLHKHGVRFLITRATRGTDYWDPTGAEYLGWARRRGWVALHYHFMDPRNGREQAENYAWNIRPKVGVVDIEAVDITTHHILDFCAQARRHFDTLGVYTRRDLWVSRGYPPISDLFDFEWIADWTAPRVNLSKWEDSIPTSPVSRLQQFTDSLRFDSPYGWHSIDGNVFQGTQFQLAEYVGLV